jgi:uncharacterized protein (TIGR00369 family)
MSAILLPYTHGCFVCGADNPHGLRLRFRVEDGEVRADFHPDARHEGYRGIIHGGVIASVLDEAMFWAAAYGSRRFHVSVQLELRYQRKVEAGKKYLLVARVVQSQKRLCPATAELRAADGEVCASATGRFFPMRREDVPLQHEDFYPDPHVLSPMEFFAKDDIAKDESCQPPQDGL